MCCQPGHQILRTPAYHPELQSIEICWGVVKNHVARNCNFTLKGLEKQIELGFQKVTPETCHKAFEKCKTFEKSFWYQDDIGDEVAFKRRDYTMKNLECYFLICEDSSC